MPATARPGARGDRTVSHSRLLVYHETRVRVLRVESRGAAGVPRGGADAGPRADAAGDRTRVRRLAGRHAELSDGFILNVCGYFDALVGFLGHAVGQRFMRPEHLAMLLVEEHPEALLTQFAHYAPPRVDKAAWAFEMAKGT